MKLANVEKDGLVRAGIVKGDFVYDVVLGPGDTPVSSVDELLEMGLIEAVRKAEPKLTSSGRRTALKDAKLKSPVLYPEKILMVGVNYRSHGKEENIQPPPYPYFFMKLRNALIGPDEPILRPRVSQKVDWEVELAAVIGKQCKDIKKEDALKYVAGYTVANDVSFRDLQKQQSPPLGLNWLKGKNLDASFPLGPWLVTSDEIPDPQTLNLTCTVNGEVKQSANTDQMIYGVADLVAYASLGMTLRPGDVISTGTPAGVGEGSGSPLLKQGDVVECRIDRIGTLRNPVVEER